MTNDSDTTPDDTRFDLINVKNMQIIHALDTTQCIICALLLWIYEPVVSKTKGVMEMISVEVECTFALYSSRLQEVAAKSRLVLIVVLRPDIRLMSGFSFITLTLVCSYNDR